MKFDAGDFSSATRDGQREALEQRKIDVHIERLRLKGGEAVGNGCKSAAYIIKIIQAFVEPEVSEIIAERLQTQEGGEFFVHPHHGILGVSPQHMVAVLAALQHAGQLAAHALVQALSRSSPRSRERSNSLWMG